MSYFHNMTNAKNYTKECEHCDATEQLALLSDVLPQNSSILELGSGPGNDLELLARDYKATGSDESPAFLSILKARHPHLSILKLDAEKIETNHFYNAIYSNKVLQHLSNAQLEKSFKRQAELLSSGGYILHLIWCHLDDAPTEIFANFEIRDEKLMTELMEPNFKIISVESYSEFKPDDSLAILAQKSNQLRG